MSQQAERRVGTVIGAKWRVDALLGSGSMAAVYAVTHRNGARAALKILHPTLCTDPAVCERFLGEGYLTNSVKHQGIVRVLDDGVTDDGCVFLVMDLLEGDTLEVLRQHRGGKIDLVEALDIADKLMDVLHAVHTAGIIHRDLKPQNVFVCHDGTVKLLDFGVARVFDRASQSKLSMFGLVLGTPSFMSPEQALGSRDKVDHRSDIWSLGATMFTALTGETVHLGANVQAKLLAAATVKARSIAMVMPGLPGPIAAAIDMALRFKKEDRWQSVDAFRRALRDARAQLGLGRPKSMMPPPADEESALDKTVRIGSPNIPKAAGSGGTLIGIGEGASASSPPRPRSNPPPVPGSPARARMNSTHPMPDRPMPSTPPVHSAAPPSPLAIVHTPPRTMDPLREGSIPAYAPDDTAQSIAAMGVRKKGTVAIWLAAFVLAAAAIGGIAFFAVKKGPLATPQQGATQGTPDVAPTLPVAPASVTPPLPAVTTPATPGTIVIPAPEPAPVPFTTNKKKDASPAVRPAIATAPPRTYGGGGHATRNPNQGRSNQGGGTAQTSEPSTTSTSAPAPTVPPDPFGTPE